MSLPFLDAMQPRFARAASVSPLAPNAAPRRMFGICNNLGLRPDLFFPAGTGREYVASPYLKLLEAHRNQFTVISGVSHPNVDGGHPSDISFLTAAPHPASSSFRNTISLDQYIAERIGTPHAVPFAHALRQRRGPQPFVDGHRSRHPAGRAGVRRFQPAFPARHTRAGRGPGPQARHRTQHPRRRRGPVEESSNAMSARATAAVSSSISRASATSSIDSRSRANGSANPNRS